MAQAVKLVSANICILYLVSNCLTSVLTKEIIEEDQTWNLSEPENAKNLVFQWKASISLAFIARF